MISEFKDIVTLDLDACDKLAPVKNDQSIDFGRLGMMIDRTAREKFGMDEACITGAKRDWGMADGKIVTVTEIYIRVYCTIYVIILGETMTVKLIEKGETDRLGYIATGDFEHMYYDLGIEDESDDFPTVPTTVTVAGSSERPSEPLVLRAWGELMEKAFPGSKWVRSGY